MSAPAAAGFAWFIGLRYSFSRKRNRFTSLIALVSMLGMVIGVASLITVLSVMNGFAGELRGRILSLVPHGFVEAGGEGMSDWQQRAREIEAMPGINATAPYITDKVIFVNGRSLHGGVLTAIDPQQEARVSRVTHALRAGSLASLEEPGFNLVLGSVLARMLNVGIGDSVEVTVPRLTVTPLGVFPRSKRLTVTGIFEVGAPPDGYQAFIGLPIGQKLLGPRHAVDGLQVHTDDLFAAPDIMRALGQNLPADYRVRDWSQTQGSLFRAVKMEKIMVSLLLLSVVAVAAFNIVSTLVMSVAEKRGDIAVLRTMGARAGSIMLIFIWHGLALALVGVASGVVLGVLLAENISTITRFAENLFGVKLFDPSVYFITELPSVLQWGDVIAVVIAAFLLSLLATLYPAWRAARVAPAEVLRYE
ncbi:lipoprotein-releasing ABC transporter permease subunit [Mangrovimicrobium sediminis]|uniref:Lipoprotein-releasing ABC transporter permease subunit n=1 Tax=Mangrovimicrobium sediminis TaxID=2562682 RepID=A0A4Z0M2E1_9GAMM|nr:lipoprotein-releasing ABC transporter permease subunit [Haliea sp. SAOS-164]TGD73597.1 lipoprotein-releasing ABC transporter permease subunit [Haliea sp. SAOS-164]